MSETVLALPPFRRALVTVAVMVATLMVVLDTTIANVTLPHMQAALGANPETVAWVLTSYIIASAIATPVTGWLADRYGRRLLLTVATAGFTLSSVLCGIAPSLEAMVAARLVQGLFGAFIIPMSQAVMYDINPPERHARAMVIWGLGVMAGPVMGPMLGGWLTDMFDWRWVFFINVPIGIVTAIALWFLVPGSLRIARRFDLTGFALIAVALMCLQLVLDRGTQQDWFTSTEIIVETAIAVAALWMFVVHSMTAREPLVPMALFADRNFVAALVLVTVAGGILTGGAALISPMLQTLLGYPVFDAGLMSAPRGVGTMIGMLIAGQLAARVDARWLILSGALLSAWSLHMMTGFSLDMDTRPIILSNAVQGMGLGLMLIPLNLLAFTTLTARLRVEAAALYSLLRTLGGSITIAVATAMMASNLQTNHAELAEHVTDIRVPLALSGLAEQVGLEGRALFAYLDLEVNRQALMIAYLDDFWLMMWAALLCVPLVFLMRPARSAGGAAAAVE
jgi:DHA2 family multidrug resistance protein